MHKGDASHSGTGGWLNHNVSDKEILRVENLSIDIVASDGRIVSPVREISFSVPERRVTAIVGESGSGKTLTALAVMGLLPTGQMRMAPGSKIYFRDRNLVGLPEQAMCSLRGKEIAMIFQDAGACLNPILTVGEQIVEPLMQHLGLSRRDAINRAIDLLNEVGIPSPAMRAKAYPHELSGGQQQRVMIAMAISCEPKLLIADEPTSALDVTVQRQILDLIARLQREHALSVIFITHDLGVVAEIADRVVVMRQGTIKEQGDKDEVLFSPSDPYTQALIASRVRIGEKRRAVSAERIEIMAQTEDIRIAPINDAKDVLLEAKNLRKNYCLRLGFWHKHILQAVKGVSFSIGRGETLGIVGESGSGKTTLAMMLVRLIDATDGSVFLEGQEVLSIPSGSFRPLRRRIQIVFQNPYASLNPRWCIRRALTEPMKLYGLGADENEREEKAARLLEKVGLSRGDLDKYPHQFSGGERQRIAIARCLTVEPEILICDECVSALDVSVQVQVLDLLRDLQDELGMSYIFISHDLAVIRHIANRVMVMHNGEVVETAETESFYAAPEHPYSRQLLSAMPKVAHWM
jgi:peptide/nickel transport system ATP-binding protein